MAEDGSTQYQFQDLILDIGLRQVRRGEEALQLGGLTFDLLRVLVESAPNIVTHDELAEKVWSARPVSPDTISQRAMMLRQALDDHAENPKYFEVIRGHGFRLIPDVVIVTESPNGRAFSLRSVLAGIAGLAIVVVALVATMQTEPVDQDGVLPNSVAVLPFENLSLKPEDAFFAIGIQDAILSQLSKISDLSVIARSSVMRYADSDLPLAEIARQLNVESIMVGTVRYADGSVRITMQLVDVKTGAQLWSVTFTRPFENIFEIETEIASAIALALEVRMLPEELERLRREPTDSPEAYEYYLKARTLLPNIGSGDVPEDFHHYLDRAIERDSDFALAYAAKAGDYAFAMRRPTLTIYGSATLADREAMANGYAQKALSIDPNLGLGYMALGLIHRFNRRGQEAVTAFERAHQLSPSDSDILDDYSRVLSELGRHEEAIPIVRRAADLRPGSWRGLAQALWRAGDNDAAADGFRRAIENGGGSAAAHTDLAMTEFMLGNYDEVRAQLALAETFDVNPQFGHRRTYLYGRIGDHEAALLSFQRWDGENGDVRTARAGVALAYLGIGDDVAALGWLQNFAENKTPYNFFTDENDIAMNTFADPVLEQPEFVEVRRNLGFDRQ